MSSVFLPPPPHPPTIAYNIAYEYLIYFIIHNIIIISAHIIFSVSRLCALAIYGEFSTIRVGIYNAFRWYALLDVYKNRFYKSSIWIIMICVHLAYSLTINDLKTITSDKNHRIQSAYYSVIFLCSLKITHIEILLLYYIIYHNNYVMRLQCNRIRAGLESGTRIMLYYMYIVTRKIIGENKNVIKHHIIQIWHIILCTLGVPLKICLNIDLYIFTVFKNKKILFIRQ